MREGLGLAPADIVTKAGPVLAVGATILSPQCSIWARQGRRARWGHPIGLPVPGLPAIDLELVRTLAVPALLISLIGFVESVSVAQTLAAKRRQRIVPDQELIGLGAANIAAAISSGYPVTGGFARSVVNFDAGAVTPAAGIFTAVGIALATLFLTPLSGNLPQATLAATIIVAVLSLVDFSIVRRVWVYSKADFSAMGVTIIGTLFWGVEPAWCLASCFRWLSISTGPAGRIWRSSAISPGRSTSAMFTVIPSPPFPEILSVRVDESLYFANSRYLEDRVSELVAEGPPSSHVILMCSAVNAIDASALESLEEINHRLQDAGIRSIFSEVKGPVMDRLKRSDFLKKLSGDVYRS